jgi:DNA-binding NarL/FixJ family response regulator
MVAERTVLIVDDNPVIRTALGTYLEHTERMTICAEAGNGFEGIEKAKLHHPDLILMDVSMPNMNGIEAAAVIKTEVPDSRIVVFTMFADTLGQSVAKAAKVDLVVPKSLGVAGLMRAIHEFVSDRPAEQQS